MMTKKTNETNQFQGKKPWETNPKKSNPLSNKSLQSKNI